MSLRVLAVEVVEENIDDKKWTTGLVSGRATVDLDAAENNTPGQCGIDAVPATNQEVLAKASGTTFDAPQLPATCPAVPHKSPGAPSKDPPALAKPPDMPYPGVPTNDLRDHAEDSQKPATATKSLTPMSQGPSQSANTSASSAATPAAAPPPSPVTIMDDSQATA